MGWSNEICIRKKNRKKIKFIGDISHTVWPELELW